MWENVVGWEWEREKIFISVTGNPKTQKCLLLKKYHEPSQGWISSKLAKLIQPNRPQVFGPRSQERPTGWTFKENYLEMTILNMQLPFQVLCLADTKAPGHKVIYTKKKKQKKNAFCSDSRSWRTTGRKGFICTRAWIRCQKCSAWGCRQHVGSKAVRLS